MLFFGVLQLPQRDRAISSQSSLRPYGQKTAIVQPSKNSDEFFSISISNCQVRYGFQHLCDERNHAIVAGDINGVREVDRADGMKEELITCWKILKTQSC
jgi:hypothetical protein